MPKTRAQAAQIAWDAANVYNGGGAYAGLSGAQQTALLANVDTIISTGTFISGLYTSDSVSDQIFGSVVLSINMWVGITGEASDAGANEVI